MITDDMINTIIYTLFWFFWCYCIFSVLYLFISAFFGRFFYCEKVSANDRPISFKRIAILVAAYKEDGVIVSSAQHHLEQDYPREAYDIFVIADSFKPETILELRQLPIQVLEVSFEKSTKLKSRELRRRRLKGRPRRAPLARTPRRWR